MTTTEMTAKQWDRHLAGAGRRLAAARAREQSVLKLARQAALAASAAGVAQTVIARQLGVDRMTVRDWIGKGPKK